MLLLLLALPAHAQTPWTTDQAAQRAVEWLRRQHQAAGFGAVDEAVAALHAIGDAGLDPRAWRDGAGVSILDALAPQAADYARRDPASAGRLVAALAAAGQDPRDFGGVNPLALLNEQYDVNRGVYGGPYATAAEQAWALLALAAVRQTPPPGVVDNLLARQAGDGGWAGDSRASDVETTALVAAALVRSGLTIDGPPLAWATSFLSRAQQASGGLSRAPTCGCPADTRSTARGVQAILLLGYDPLSGGWNRPGGSPPDWLRLRQDPSGGLAWFGFGPADPLSTALAVSALLGRPPGAPAVVPALRSGAAWLQARQTPDGGYAPQGDVADVDLTLESVYALAAADLVGKGRGPAPTDTLAYLAAHAPRATATDIGRLILAVVALGGDPRDLAGDNLLVRLDALYNREAGSYGPRATDQAWALLALAAVHRTPPAQAVTRLVDLQGADGGWRLAPDAPTDTGTTALAAQALAAVGGGTETRRTALAYLRARQQPDGGFEPAANVTTTSTRATAAALQALLALGERPDGPAWAQHLEPGNGSPLPANTPLRALLQWQLGDGGFPLEPDFAEADALATAQAVAALAGRPQPVRWEMVRIFLPLVSH